MGGERSPSARRTPTASLGQSSRRVKDRARRLFPLVEREDLIQVAQEALVRSAPRCRAGEPAGPYLRRCIAGALQHHLCDRVRLVRLA